MNRIYNICKITVSTLFGIIVGWLFIMNSFTVCYMNSNEHTYFTRANSIIKITVLLFIIFLFSWICNSYTDLLNKEIKHENLIRWIILAVILCISLSWVFATRANCVSDQFEVMNAAAGLKNGDYSSFVPGGYISYYTVQAGLVFFQYLLSFIFGDFNYLAFQIISSVAIAASWNSIYEIAKLSGFKSFGRLVILGIGVLFLPYTFYSSFVYGTVIGFAFAVAALKYELWFIESGRWKWAILASISCAIGILVKSNYMIFLVAMICILAIWIMKDSKRATVVKSAVLAILIIVMFLAQSKGVTTFVQRKTGQTFDNSMSTLAWLEMGLQDNGTRGPGWYNAYNYNTYFAADCNSELQSIMVKEDLRSTVSDMLNHKGDTIRFFSKKTASQWLNPTYQSLWTLQQSGSTKQVMPSLLSELIAPTGNVVFTEIFEILLYIYLFGIFIFVLLSVTIPNDKQISIQNLAIMLLEIVFIGGFIFYFFWEAKGQYTIVYMVLMAPVCVKGYELLFEETNHITEMIEKKSFTLNNYKASLWIGSFCVIVCFSSLLNVHVRDMIRPCDDIERFEKYKVFYFVEPSVDMSGDIKISPVVNQNVFLTNDGESIVCREEEKTVFLQKNKGAYHLGFPDGRFAFGYLNGENSYNIEAAKKAENDMQMWRVDANEDGTYCIYSADGFAMTYDESGYVYLREIEGSEFEKWIVDR